MIFNNKIICASTIINIFFDNKIICACTSINIFFDNKIISTSTRINIFFDNKIISTSTRINIFFNIKIISTGTAIFYCKSCIIFFFYDALLVFISVVVIDRIFALLLKLLINSSFNFLRSIWILSLSFLTL